MRAIRASVSSFLFLAIFALQSWAADPPLTLSATFDLSKQNVKAGACPTFFLFMSRMGGIKAALDSDYTEEFTITSAEDFRAKAAGFDHIDELERKVRGGAKGMDLLVSKLEGKTLTVDKMYGAVMGVMKKEKLFVSSDAKANSRLAGAIVPLIAMASGKGVLVQLDDGTYVYNYGYAEGSGGADLEADKVSRRTGRSYGASRSRNAYDPTDRDYLTGLSKYVAKASDKELRAYYEAVFKLLIKTDPSGIKKVNRAGQTVLADFMAIYMAELDRHLMTGLKRYEWENALTEITMLAAYSVSDEGKTLDPRTGAENTNERGIVESSIIDPDKRLLGYFGVGTDGSGLDGRNKQRRHNLTKQVVREMRKLDPDSVKAIEEIIGARRGSDIYDDVMNHLNAYGTQQNVQDNADELIDALVEFSMSTRANAASISENLQ